MVLKAKNLKPLFGVVFYKIIPPTKNFLSIARDIHI